jgi:hypothetical protein
MIHTTKFKRKTMLDKEFNYYRNHQSELVKKYDGKFIVIREEMVVGAYGTQVEAYTEAKKKYEVGTFLIQHCTPGLISYTHSFHSRVAFR